MYMDLAASKSKMRMCGVDWYATFFICFHKFLITLQIAYRLQNWRNAFASTAMNAVKEHIEGSEMASNEIVEAVEAFLTPDGNPPSSPYFWRDWEIANDGSVKKSV